MCIRVLTPLLLTQLPYMADLPDIRQEQIDLLYKEIGRYVVEFEMMCHAMQMCITFSMSSHGLRNQQISQAVIAGLTAEPLCALLRSLISETIEIDDDECHAIDYLFRLVKTAIEDRNRIIHSTWHIGWGNSMTTDWSVAKGSKPHKSKKGVCVRNSNMTKEAFSELTNDLIYIRKALLLLIDSLVGSAPVSENFILRDGEGINRLHCPHMPRSKPQRKHR